RPRRRGAAPAPAGRAPRRRRPHRRARRGRGDRPGRTWAQRRAPATAPRRTPRTVPTDLPPAPPRRLQLLDAPRPIALEEPGQRAVRQQHAARLAARAVVGLVLGVDDALHG